METFASFPSSKIVSTTVAAACDENCVKIIILPHQCNQIFPFHMQKLQLINASQSVCYILKALHQIGTPSALLNPFECAPHSSLNFTRRVNNVSTFSLHLHFDNHSQPWEENLSTSYLSLTMLKRAVLHQNWGFNIDLESWCGKSALMLAKMLFPHRKSGSIFLVFSCDQAALRTPLSVRPSVRLSVCLSHPFHYVPLIISSWNFQELLLSTKVMSMQEVKVRG